MATNRKDLKAFVRYDGSGRVVASSLILRKKKPKVGKWMQIQTYECCEPTTTPTTTQPPLVSDIRLKDNITATGNVVNGLMTYTWEWNATAKALGLAYHHNEGFLAQEVLEMYPDAVMYDPVIGYLVVNYNEITND